MRGVPEAAAGGAGAAGAILIDLELQRGQSVDVVLVSSVGLVLCRSLSHYIPPLSNDPELRLSPAETARSAHTTFFGAGRQSELLRLISLSVATC